jgi:hypothetical protein
MPIEHAVPYVNIANSTEGHLYAFSPSINGDSTKNKWDTARLFSGARSVLSLLVTAAASTGQIAQITAPYSHSSYSLTFFGPDVRCRRASSAERSDIDNQLVIHKSKPVGTAEQVENTYYAFVPAFDDQRRVVSANDRVQVQAPANRSNSSNEIWMTFLRYVDKSNGTTCDYTRYHQVCELFNSTYHLDLSWDNGVQRISGTQDPLHQVEFPNDNRTSISNMSQHAYSAFMSVLASQLVGSFGWFQDTANRSIEFGIIAAPLQHNVLLGTDDLDVFFNLNEDPKGCQVPYANLSSQRRLDKDFAKNQTLDVLIPALVFNMTATLLQNPYLTLVQTFPSIISLLGKADYGAAVITPPPTLPCGRT